MNFMDSVTTCLSKYVDFDGRAKRSEYWWFQLFCIIIYIVTATIAPRLYYIAALALFLPTLAVTVRRLHDGDRTGWWVLISLIPIVGGLILLYFMIIEGTQGSNRFGVA